MWIVLYVVAVQATGRRPGPPVVADAPVRPAVRDLVRGADTRRQYVSTLHDLAGRGWLEIREDRIRRAGDSDEPLWGFEREALALLGRRLAGTPEAPLAAVVPGTQDLEEFAKLVRHSGRELGLHEPRWPNRVVPILLAVALLVPGFMTVDLVHWDLFEGFVLFALFGGAWAVGRGVPRYRVTPAGRELAGRSAGEPRSVPAEEAWSPENGEWHRVEVDKTPAPSPTWVGMLVGAVFTGIGTLMALFGAIGLTWPLLIFGVLFGLAGLWVLGSSVLRWVRGLDSPRQALVAGRVVSRWTHSTDTDNSSGIDHYVAVDHGDEPVSYVVEPGFHDAVQPGDSVELVVNPRLRRLVRVVSHVRHS